jgi:hypothetical protein
VSGTPFVSVIFNRTIVSSPAIGLGDTLNSIDTPCSVKTCCADALVNSALEANSATVSANLCNPWLT